MGIEETERRAATVKKDVEKTERDMRRRCAAKNLLGLVERVSATRPSLGTEQWIRSPAVRAALKHTARGVYWPAAARARLARSRSESQSGGL